MTDTWTNCTPDGQPPVVGNEYRVAHARKGTFCGVVRSADATTWADVEIVDGVAHAILPENIKLSGEIVTVRSSLCKMTPIA